MIFGIRAKLLTVLGPTLTLGLLAAGAYVQRGWPQPEDATPYHARAAAAIKAIPLRVGPWVGTERDPQPAAIEILQPNAIRNIELIDPRPRTIGRPEQRISLSVVQTKRIDDMMGHSPPNCYPAFGDRQTVATYRTWPIGTVVSPASTGKSAGADASASDLRINGVEYQFERVIDGRSYRRIVYNFMIARRRGILPDMESLRQAAEDYEQRYFGAAQFQVVFDSLAGHELAVGDRDEVFTTLMTAAEPAIRALLDETTGKTPSLDLATNRSPAGEVVFEPVSMGAEPGWVTPTTDADVDPRWRMSQ